MKNWEERIKDIAVIWAVIALIPFVDWFDIPLIILFSKLLNLSYTQTIILYHSAAVLTLILLAPKKLQKVYNKIKNYF